MARTRPALLLGPLVALIPGCRPSPAAPAGPVSSGTVLIAANHHPGGVAGVLRVCGPQVEHELGPVCKKAGVRWPPKRITLLAFKQERVLEVWGANATGSFHRMMICPVLAASGRGGPKRREGDFQVPEGAYRLDVLNPLSRFHLSIRVAYPNAEDVANATVPRVRMGGDIYVHGNRVSAGCLAIGDAAIERVFTLVAQADPDSRRILIAPVDLRTIAEDPPADSPWVSGLYRRLRTELGAFREPLQGRGRTTNAPNSIGVWPSRLAMWGASPTIFAAELRSIGRRTGLPLKTP